MNLLSGMQLEFYFDDAAGLGIIGNGETIDLSFGSIASHMFALMHNVEQVHLMQIITFEFSEENMDKALFVWLNLLLDKAKEHQLMFGDFRLKREGIIWKATVSGERIRQDIKREIEITKIIPGRTALTKIEHQWQTRCVTEINQPVRIEK